MALSIGLIPSQSPCQEVEHLFFADLSIIVRVDMVNKLCDLGFIGLLASLSGEHLGCPSDLIGSDVAVPVHIDFIEDLLELGLKLKVHCVLSLLVHEIFNLLLVNRLFRVPLEFKD